MDRQTDEEVDMMDRLVDGWPDRWRDGQTVGRIDGEEEYI